MAIVDQNENSILGEGDKKKLPNKQEKIWLFLDNISKLCKIN